MHWQGLHSTLNVQVVPTITSPMLYACPGFEPDMALGSTIAHDDSHRWLLVSCTTLYAREQPADSILKTPEIVFS